MGLIMVRRERDRAEDSSRQAKQAVDHFVARVSEDKILNQPGLNPLRKELLQDTQRFYEDFLNRRSGDRSFRVEVAAARARVAQITGLIGSTTEAIGQYQQAVTLWDDLVAAQPTRTVYQEELARILNEQGTVIMRLSGHRDEALRIFHRAQDLIQSIVADTRSVTADRQLSIALQNIAGIQLGQGQLTEGATSIRQSLKIDSKLAAEDPRLLDLQLSLARGHAILGQILAAQPEGSEPALAEYQQAVERLEKITREHPQLPEQACELAFFLGDMNRLQQTAGQFDSALATLSKAVEILERIDHQYPGILDYQGGLARAYNMMSNLHRYRHEPTEALAFAEKAQTMLQRLIALNPDDDNLRLDLANSQNNLGRLLQQTGEPIEALRSFQRAVDLYESISELDPRNNYNLGCNIALSIPLIGVKNGSGGTVDVSKLSKSDQLRRERYGKRAIEVLRQAAEGGFLTLDLLQSDTDFNPIRDRSDFQDLIKEVEKKTGNAAK